MPFNNDGHLETLATAEEADIASVPPSLHLKTMPAPEYNGAYISPVQTGLLQRSEIDAAPLERVKSVASLHTNGTSGSTDLVSYTASQDSFHHPAHTLSNNSSTFGRRWDQASQIGSGIMEYHGALADQDHLPTGSLVSSYGGSVGRYPQPYAHSSEAFSIDSKQLGIPKTKERVHRASEKTNEDEFEDPQPTNQHVEGDPEALTLRNERILGGRKTLSKTRRIVIGICIVVGILSILATIVLLVLSRSKVMARASFLAGTMLVEVALGMGMWAGELSTVEVLIGMNIVFVFGIFLTSNIDALMAERAF